MNNNRTDTFFYDNSDPRTFPQGQGDFRYVCAHGCLVTPISDDAYTCERVCGHDCDERVRLAEERAREEERARLAREADEPLYRDMSYVYDE